MNYQNFTKNSLIPTAAAIAAASFRFVFSVSCALLASWYFHDNKIGGFAALTCFMCLMCDQSSDVKGRLTDLGIVAAGIVCVSFIAYYANGWPMGKWLILAGAGIGVFLLPFAEKFWWLVGKMFLVVFMVSLFDFRPDLSSLFGFLLGVALAGVVIVLDGALWKKDNLGDRPLDEINRVLAGDKNSWVFAVISAAGLILALASAKLFGVMEAAWVGISYVYLVNTKISAGFKRSVQRVVGTLLGYFLCLLLFPYAENTLVLGLLIVGSTLFIPYFIVKNYLWANFFLTVFILLMLDWLLMAYGGDWRLLQWRFFDTLYGALWAAAAMLVSGIPLFWRSVPALEQELKDIAEKEFGGHRKD